MEVYVAKDIFVHVFYGGKPQTFRASEYPYDIGQNSDSGNVVAFTESVLGVERGTLSNFVVDKVETDETVNFTVRPSEVFGL